jgi:hypothetical protein
METFTLLQLHDYYNGGGERMLGRAWWKGLINRMRRWEKK